MGGGKLSPCRTLLTGGRFGWALVKNAETAALMREYVSAQTLGLDISSQLRMVNVLRTLAVQGA